MLLVGGRVTGVSDGNLQLLNVLLYFGPGIAFHTAAEIWIPLHIHEAPRWRQWSDSRRVEHVERARSREVQTAMGWKNNEGSSKGLFPESVRNTLGPLLLILITPFVALVLSRAVTRPGGGFLQGVFDAFMEVTVNPVDFVFRDALDPTAWKIIAVYSGFELLLMRLMPGPEFRGPISPCGNVPLYKLNGVKCFLFSVAAFGAGVYLKIFPGSIVFDNFVKLTAAMNLFAFGFCGFLTVKGFCFPSSSDSGSSGNVVMDFYWGTELYPRILGWDVKVFTNCRFGMMFWGLGSISFACAQYEHHGVLTLPMLVSVSLQFIYVFKLLG